MYDDRICKGHPRHEKIKLTCKNHPGLSWHTKNIDYIGARSLFFDQYSELLECQCPIGALEHVCNLPEIPA